MLHELRTSGSFFRSLRTTEGKITLLSLCSGAFLLALVGIVLFETPEPVRADDVSTSVTVLNTPPTWTVNAQELVASATSTPTNSGANITWIATADDSSGDRYYLLICKTSGLPTANANTAPSCNGGVANQWAVSASTTVSVQAAAATTTKETFPFENEKNDWFAWVCDGNAALPRCFGTFTTGNEFGDNGSPFVINHPPVFAATANDGPENPGGTVTWSSTSYDNDVLSGANDQIRLFVCRAAGFSTSTGCTGAGGGWATSTLTATNAATTTDIVVPTRDGLYDAFVYLMDEHNHAATSSFQASNSSFTVNNVAPALSSATISLEDVDNVGNLTLATPEGQTSGFEVRFTATDNNSCQNIVSGNELTSAIANIYRTGVGSTSCQVSGDYNSNNCYANASPLFSPYISCTQDGGSCSGSSDSTATWTCTFSVWYNADPTDASTPWTAEGWQTTVQIGDDDFATSTLTESLSGNEMTSFLAFNVSQTTIAFGSLEPGQFNDPLATTTDLVAIGNVGLDEDLHGDTMCTTTEWTGPDTCDTNGINPANDIPVNNQKIATSSVAYAATEAFTLTGSSTPTELTIRVPKTTATSSPQERDTYWGINIPIAITTAGSYEGQNTITAKKSAIGFW
ncbi:MAG: hypothetical protein WA021_03630 [Minisyncoccia bacterium]